MNHTLYVYTLLYIVYISNLYIHTCIIKCSDSGFETLDLRSNGQAWNRNCVAGTNIASSAKIQTGSIDSEFVLVQSGTRCKIVINCLF